MRRADLDDIYGNEISNYFLAFMYYKLCIYFTFYFHVTKYINEDLPTVSSNSKVIFSGLGADEVFGGYARYKTAFGRGGIEEMESEMSLDLDRIWHRNMGRDDRVISACGKEARFPYLDIDLMKFLSSSCPTSELCNWEDFRGKGDKNGKANKGDKEDGMAGTCQKN